MMRSSSVFYMNRVFTSRHLTQVRSPLMKGFVSPLHSSITRNTMSTSAVGSTALVSLLTSITASSVSGVGVTQDIAMQLQSLTAQLQLALVETCGLTSVVTFILARGTHGGGWSY